MTTTQRIRRFIAFFSCLAVLTGLLALNGGIAQAQNVAAAADAGKTVFINNVWADTDIRQALRDVAEQAEVTIIPDATVQGFVSTEVRDANIEQALEIICRSGGYAYRRINTATQSYFVVGLPDPTNPNFSALVDVCRVPLNNIKAVDINSQLSPFYSKFVAVDKINNVLVITAPPAIAQQIMTAINTIDQKAPQVVIECLIAEISRKDSKLLDGQFRWNNAAFGLPVDANGRPISNPTIGNNILSWTQISAADMLNLRMLADHGKARIRATPRITTLNARAAEIFVGSERYFSVLTGNVNFATTQLQQVLAGIKLKIVPFIGAGNDILVELEPEVSDVVGIGSNGAPEVATRRVKTSVRVTDGATIALGGLNQTTRRRQVSKVPILGDIPILGAFFRSVNDADVETEALIFIRPHLLKEGEIDWRGPSLWDDLPPKFQPGVDSTADQSPCLTWNPMTRSLLFGQSNVDASGWYGIGNKEGSEVYIAVTVGKNSIQGVIEKYDVNGGDHADALAVNVKNTISFHWKMAKNRITQLYQSSSVDGVTKNATFDAKSETTNIGGKRDNGLTILANTFRSNDIMGQKLLYVQQIPMK